MNREQVPILMADVVLLALQMQTAFKIQTHKGAGTCFLYANRSGPFMVTAAHLLKGAAVGDKIRFAFKDGWLDQELRAVFIHPEGYDVAAFVTDLPASYPAPADDEIGVMPGQSLKFVGFPHGLHGEYPSQVGFPTPLVRTAHFSGTIIRENKRLTLLDGFNNPGYSGAPVYCCGNDGKAKLFGIVSGYKWEREEHSKVYEKRPDGTYVPTAGYIVRPNSGMIYVVGSGEFKPFFSAVNKFQPSPPVPQSDG